MRQALYLAAFVRALSTSALAVAFGVSLAERGLSVSAIGAIVSAGLAGTAVSAAVVTWWAHRVRPRSWLMSVAALSTLGLVGLYAFEQPLLLGAAAFIGMANGMGRDRGAALVIEQALLPATGTSHERTRTLARYTMLQDIGHALGALLPGLLGGAAHGSPAADGRIFGALIGLGGLTVVLYASLRQSPAATAPSKRPALSPRSRSILTRICSLFAVDAIAGGFLTAALVSYFFFERFGVGLDVIGPLFFGARLMNAASHLLAAKLAERIGLVNTMVFTHIPSSLLLVTVAFAPNLSTAIVLFLLREGLVEMDVPTRQSYVLAVVEPGERTFASGITNLVRLAAWAVAPWLAGSLMQGRLTYLPLVIGAALKIAYDLLLWRAFRATRPPEEQEPSVS